MEHDSHNNHKNMGHNEHNHYKRFYMMIVLSFIAMYLLMYSMINKFPDFYNNLNQFYMAGLMAGSMVVIELAIMWSMYKNKKLNTIVLGVSVVALVLFWVFTRQQVLISDKQFLKSMIPHHSGAILMCREAQVQDAEIKDLCKNITSSQQAEIDQMKGILARLEK